MIEDDGRREIIFSEDLSSSCVVGPFGLAASLGDDFGSTENIRFTYAASLQEIEKGCERIEAAIKKIE